MMRPRRPSVRESGQAAVEAALTLPLVLFLILGTLQLFMLMHGRILTQMAAFAATRAGSVNHGNCTRMTHAALVQLMPAIESFMKPGGGSPGAKLAAAFGRRRNGFYADRASDGGNVLNYTGAIVWIAREQPSMATVAAFGNGQDSEFDQPSTPMRLETRVVFWYPMRIPFANWVMSRMFLVNFRLQDYTAQNPLMATQQASWNAANSGTSFNLDTAIGVEMAVRASRGELVFPISATYTMRMMTPAKATNFRVQHCPPTPQSL